MSVAAPSAFALLANASDEYIILVNSLADHVSRAENRYHLRKHSRHFSRIMVTP
jgi:hypothetical protein